MTQFVVIIIDTHQALYVDQHLDDIFNANITDLRDGLEKAAALLPEVITYEEHDFADGRPKAFDPEEIGVNAGGWPERLADALRICAVEGAKSKPSLLDRVRKDPS